MTSADFTIADVLAWARTKPADEAYQYDDNDNCALCQFLRETGRCAKPSAGGDYWRDAGVSEWAPISLPEGLEYPLQTGTFGALAARLEALLPAEPLSDTWTKADAYLTDIEAVESVEA